MGLQAPMNASNTSPSSPIVGFDVASGLRQGQTNRVQLSREKDTTTPKNRGNQNQAVLTHVSRWLNAGCACYLSHGRHQRQVKSPWIASSSTLRDNTPLPPRPPTSVPSARIAKRHDMNHTDRAARPPKVPVYADFLAGTKRVPDMRGSQAQACNTKITPRNIESHSN